MGDGLITQLVFHTIQQEIGQEEVLGAATADKQVRDPFPPGSQTCHLSQGSSFMN